MSSRQMEIEARKARIAELKRLREEKRMRSISSSSNFSESKHSSTLSKDIDDLVNSLVGPSASISSTPSETPRNASSLSNRDVHSPGTPISSSSLAGSPRTSLPGAMKPPVLPEFDRDDSFTSTTDVVAQPAVATRPEIITYSKEIQTSESWLRDQQTDTTERDANGAISSSPAAVAVATSALSREEMDRLREAIRAEVEEEFKRKMEREAAKREPQLAGNEKEQSFSDIDIEICNDKNTQDTDEIQYEEKEQAADELAQFLDQSLKVVSRALDYDYDITTDYASTSNGGGSGPLSNLGGQGSASTGPATLTEMAQFFSEEHSTGRAITDLDWSPFHPELLASAHTEQRVGAVGLSPGPKGLVQVWNMHAQSRPEYVFTARSDVLAVRFSPFDASILLGTAYNGQVMAWDMRVPPRGGGGSGKGLLVGYRDPVLTSPLNGSGHTHPTYTMAVTGTQHAHTVLTASTDGVVCTWAPDMLAVPQDRLTLSAPFSSVSSSSSAGLSGLSGLSGAHGLMASMSGSRSDDVAPTQLAVLPRDSSRFVIGTEEGAIYACARFGQAGARAGIVGVNDGRPLSSSLSSSPVGGGNNGGSSIGGVYRGHCAPVTSLDFHSSRGPSDFSDLLLSASLDWSIKLWRVNGSSSSSSSVSAASASLSSHYNGMQTSPTRGGSGGLASLGLGSPGSGGSGSGTGGIAPLLDIPRDYEVYDVSWSPAHAAVFAAVDGSGHVEVWDLSRDAEAPVARAKPGVYRGQVKRYGRGVEEGEDEEEDDRDWRRGQRGPRKSPVKNGRMSHLGTPTAATSAEFYGGEGASAGEYLLRPLNRVAWDKVSPEDVGEKKNKKKKEEGMRGDGREEGGEQDDGEEEERGGGEDGGYLGPKKKNKTSGERSDGSGHGGGSRGPSQGPSKMWGSGGRRLAVGGVDGVVTVFGLEAEGVCMPKAGDWLRMERLVAQLEEDAGGDGRFV